MDIGNDKDRLHVFFFPFTAYGHLIPTIDMAMLFASQGAKATIIATSFCVPILSKNIGSNVEIGVKVLKFPYLAAGLPEGCKNIDSLRSYAAGPDAMNKFVKGTRTLKEPLEQLLEECRPDCLVADMCFPWATESAAKFGIPRLVFHGSSFFYLCSSLCIRLYKPHKKVSSDSEPFVVPHLPGDIKYTRKQLPDFAGETGNEFQKLLNESKESELKSYGVVVNSFYELEKAYADFYRNHLGRRAWHIGPVSLRNKGSEDKEERGKKASVGGHECLKWLDSKKPNSIIYICFGSFFNFSDSQLMEIAMGLEASGQEFIWVVRKDKNDDEEKEEWLPEGFEKRMEGKGLIIRGWAPQLLILEHEAAGAFVTHCGWNSTLEAISAGVPMVTWPIAADQFDNEKLVIQVLKSGISLGVEQWAMVPGDIVRKEKIERAVKEVMEGDEAEEMRSRAKALAEMAGRAIKNGGSSYSDLKALIEELSLLRQGPDTSKKTENPEAFCI